MLTGSQTYSPRLVADACNLMGRAAHEEEGRAEDQAAQRPQQAEGATVHGAQAEALDQDAPDHDAHDGQRDGEAAYEQVGVGRCDRELALQELGQEGGHARHHGRHAHLGQDHQQKDGVAQRPQQHPGEDCRGKRRGGRSGRAGLPHVSIPSRPGQLVPCLSSCLVPFNSIALSFIP